MSAVLLLVLLACSHSSVDPQSGLTSGCVTDLECPNDQECGSGSCQPLAPSLYPHIQTASALFRDPLDDGEVLWRATHYDLLIAAVGPWADEIRTANPNARLFEYNYTRYNRFDRNGDATQWAQAHGVDPEDFYLHYRQDVSPPSWSGFVMVDGYPAGVVPGWNPAADPGDPPASATSRDQSRVPGVNYGGATSGADAWKFFNITNASARTYLIDLDRRMIDGSFYGHSYALGPLDGMVHDNGLYYPQFGEGQLEYTDEFYGLPLDDNHPYAVGFETFYPQLARTLAAHFGHAIDVMPNYGDVWFLSYDNPIPRTVQSTTPWAWAEAWMMYRGTSTPTRGATACITYDRNYDVGLASVVRQCRAGGRRVLGAKEPTLGGTDRGKIFTLALYYLIQSRHTYYLYETGETRAYNDPIQQWQWNPAVEFDIGQPAPIPQGTVDFEGHYPSTEYYEFASGPDPYRPDLTYHVLARRYTNALVLAKMLPAGSVVDDQSITVHPLDGSYMPLNADGSLGAAVTSVSLRNNEGAILIPVN